MAIIILSSCLLHENQLKQHVKSIRLCANLHLNLARSFRIRNLQFALSRISVYIYATSDIEFLLTNFDIEQFKMVLRNSWLFQINWLLRRCPRDMVDSKIVKWLLQFSTLKFNYDKEIELRYKHT